MKKHNQLLVMGLVVAVLAGGGGFFAGMQYQQSRRSSLLSQSIIGQGRIGSPSGQAGMMGFRNGGRNGFRPVAGEIIKSDDTSITVKLADGSSKIVMIASTTEIRKTDLGAKSDLVTGIQIAVFGSENADGSVTAQNIQINPIRLDVVTPKPTQ